MLVTKISILCVLSKQFPYHVVAKSSETKIDTKVGNIKEVIIRS